MSVKHIKKNHVLCFVFLSFVFSQISYAIDPIKLSPRTDISQSPTELPVKINVTLDTKSFYDSNGNTNIAKSHLDVAAIKQFNSQGVRHIFQLHTHLSCIPFLLRDKTQKALNQVVEEKVGAATNLLNSTVAANQQAINNAQQQLNASVAAAGQSADQQIRAGLLVAVTNNPALAGLSQSDRDAIYNQQYALLMAQAQNTIEATRLAHQSAIDTAQASLNNAEQTNRSAIASAHAAKLREINDRLNQIQIETTIQELAVTYARQSESSVMFVQLGKLAVEGSGSRAGSDLRPVNDPVESLLGTMGTGALHFGYVTYANKKSREKGFRISSDLYIFHDRIPLIDGQQLVADIISMDQNTYDEHRKFMNLNMGLLKLMIENEHVTFFVTGAAGEHTSWKGAGFDIRLPKNFSIVARAYAGDRQQGSMGTSLYLAKRFDLKTSQITPYVGVSYVGGRHSALRFDQVSFDMLEYVAGLRWTIQGRVMNFLFDPSLYVEGYYQQLSSVQNQYLNNNGIRIGISAKMGDIPTPEEAAQMKIEEDHKLLAKLQKEQDARARKTKPNIFTRFFRRAQN